MRRVEIAPLRCELCILDRKLGWPMHIEGILPDTTQLRFLASFRREWASALAINGRKWTFIVQFEPVLRSLVRRSRSRRPNEGGLIDPPHFSFDARRDYPVATRGAALG